MKRTGLISLIILVPLALFTLGAVSTPKPGWQKKSFNGMDYYIVPLHAGSPEVQATEKEKP